MRILRLVAFVFGALWFIPVSCTTGLVGGTWALTRLDARDVEKGQEPHRLFFVVVSPGRDKNPFSVIQLKELSHFKTTVSDYSFLMPRESNQIKIDARTFCSYRVIADTENHQTIEVVWTDDDKTTWSTYRATRSDVVPLYSRMYYQGYMFRALPLALVFAALIFGAGRLVRRRIDHSSKEE